MSIVRSDAKATSIEDALVVVVIIEFIVSWDGGVCDYCCVEFLVELSHYSIDHTTTWATRKE